MSEIGQKLIDETRKVAEANPRFVYDEAACRYVKNGKPSCLIGHALWNLGLINEGFEVNNSNAIVAWSVLRDLGVKVSCYEEDWLSCAQSSQDSEQSWGRAVTHADEEAGELYEVD